MAHFRKYYANNTAFSFSIPPRTSLMGMVATAMGWPKDSYYEKLSSENIRFGLRVLSPLKKSFHRLNLLSVKSIGDMAKKWSSDLRGENGRIQTPFEVVTGWNIGKDEVVYQIFVSPTENGKAVFDRIQKHLLNEQPIYNTSLGTANFNASISDVQLLADDKIEKKNTDDFVLLNTAVPTEKVVELRFDKEEYENYNFVEEDMLPGDFKANGNREVVKMNKLLFSITPHPLRVRLKASFYQIQDKEEHLNIQFIDA